MKKMIVAAGLALALTASARQEASAWCKFNLSAGVNLSYESTGCNVVSGGWSWTPNPSPYGCAPACAAPGFNYYQGYTGYPAAYGYAQPAPAAPAATAPAAAPARTTQQVGYYFYSQSYAPSYWYGY